MEEFLISEELKDFIPRKPNPANVFRRVTGSLAGIYHKDDLRYKVDVVRVSERTNLMERVLMVVEVDEENRELSEGKKVARLLFNKLDGSFGYITEYHTPGLFDREIDDDLSSIPDFLYKKTVSLGEEIKTQLNYLSTAQVRGIFFNILKSSGIPSEGIPMLWTIHNKKESTVSAFKNLADKVNSISRSKVIFYRTENILDTKDKRDVISTDAVTYATNQFRKLVCDIYEKVEEADDPDKALEKAQKRFSKESNAVISLIKEYEDIIGDKIKEIEAVKKHHEQTLKDFEITPNVA
jgi:hypothetical protein